MTILDGGKLKFSDKRAALIRFSLSFIVVFASPMMLKLGSPLRNLDSPFTILSPSPKLAHFKAFFFS